MDSCPENRAWPTPLAWALLASFLGCTADPGPTPAAADDTAAGDDTAPDDDTTPDDDKTATDDDATSDDDATPFVPLVNGVVLFVIDAMRADRLACGESPGSMPFAESLSASGTCFNAAHADASWTMPGTASILTGLHYDSHKLRDPSDDLREETRLLPDLLRPAGFVSVQKAANPLAWQAGIAERFDVVYNEGIVDGAMTSELDPGVAEAAGQAIADLGLTADTPFLFHLHFVAPHAAYCPPQVTETSWKGLDFCAEEDATAIAHQLRGENTSLMDMARALYTEETTWTDTQIASAYQAFVDAGLAESTVFVLTGDHGEEMNEHGNWGHDTGVWAEQTRVPLVLAGAGIPAGQVVTGVVEQADITPTVLDLVGLAPEPGIEGRSLLPFVEDPDHAGPFRAFISDELPDAGGRVEAIVASAPDGGVWKLVTLDDNEVNLFDLSVDPWETQDLTGAEGTQDVARVLKGMLADKILDWDAWVTTYY